MSICSKNEYKTALKCQTYRCPEPQGEKKNIKTTVITR